MANRFIYKHRRGTTEQWATSDSIIYDGEIVVEKPNDGYIRLKVGDGTKKFSELPYMNIPMDSFPKELLKITVTSSDSTYSADKTDSDIKSCLDNGGIPYIALYDTVFIYEGYSSDIGYMFIDTNDGKMLCIYNNSVSLYSSNLKSKLDSTVSTTAQTLTDEQKAQARTNIGAGGLQVQSDYIQNDNTQTDYIKNRPFYEDVSISIEWDGDTTGKISVADAYYHVSPETPSPEELVGATVSAYYNGTVNSFVIPDGSIVSGENYAIFRDVEDWFMVTYADNVTVKGQIFPAKGVYFPKVDSSMTMYVTAIRKTELKKLDSKFIDLPQASPDALGGVKADAADTADTQPVRIGGDGKLYTAPGSGGGTDISLGISGATAGQMAKVKAVDASGAPTAWEAGDAATGGGSSEFNLLLDITLEEAIYALILKNDSNGNPISCNEIFAALYIPETFTGTQYFIGAFYPDASAGQIAVKFSSGNRHYTTIYVTPVGGMAAVSKSTNAYSVPVDGVSSFAITPGGNATNDSSSVFEHPEKLTGIRLQGDWRGQTSLPIGTKVILYGR